MIDDLLLHPTTKAAVTHFAKTPSHALLLAGPDGMGKGTVASHLAAGALRISTAKLAAYPYAQHLTPDEKGTISIDAIRGLQQFLRLKTLGKASIRRAVVIEQADAMTIEAQNAFLKVLEEPPDDTIIIMTAANQRSVLPTILSRMQVIMVTPPSEQAVQVFFTAKGYSAASIKQAYLLSGGMPGLMSALLADEAHPMLKSITTAKQLLGQTLFERLAAVETLSKQRDEAIAVIAALHRIAATMLSQAATSGDAGKTKQWHRILKLAANARTGLEQSGNVKLLLSNTMLHM